MSRQHLSMRGPSTMDVRNNMHRFSAEYNTLYTKINNLKSWNDKLVKEALALISLEDEIDVNGYLNESDARYLGKTRLEYMGRQMVKAARLPGLSGGLYEKALRKIGECECNLGKFNKDFIVDICSSFIKPLKHFAKVELAKLNDEKDMLKSRKVDYEYQMKNYEHGRTDKVSQHKLKMSETALEFQYERARSAVYEVEVSEFQIGHLCDLINMQRIYHNKCLKELNRVKSELVRLKVVQDHHELEIRVPVLGKLGYSDKGDGRFRSPGCGRRTSTLDSDRATLNQSASCCQRKSISYNDFKNVRTEVGEASSSKIGRSATHNSSNSMYNHRHSMNVESRYQLTHLNHPASPSKHHSRRSSSRDPSPPEKETKQPQTSNSPVDLEQANGHETQTDESIYSKETHIIQLPAANKQKKPVGQIFFNSKETTQEQE